jgi:hypothetical protein
MATKPFEHISGLAIWGKDRIKDFFDQAIVGNPSQSPEQRNSCHFYGRQAESCCQFQI